MLIYNKNMPYQNDFCTNDSEPQKNFKEDGMTILFLIFGCTAEGPEHPLADSLVHLEPAVDGNTDYRTQNEPQHHALSKPKIINHIDKRNNNMVVHEPHPSSENLSNQVTTTNSDAIAENTNPSTEKKSIKPSSTISKEEIVKITENSLPVEEIQKPESDSKKQVGTIVPEKIKKKKRTYAKPNPQCTHKIKKVLRKNKGEILFCYDQQVVKTPDLEGKITIQINIHQTQNSIWVKNDTLKDKGLRSCIKNKIRRWKFGSECHGTSFRKSYSLVAG
jgi:hypothetical protein